jgi:hypothetical protein
MLAYIHIDNSLTCSRLVTSSLSARAGGRLELCLHFDNYMLPPLSSTPQLTPLNSVHTQKISIRKPQAQRRELQDTVPILKNNKGRFISWPRSPQLESLCRPAADEAPLGILIRSVSSYLNDAKCNFAIHATKEIEKARVHNQSTVPRCLFMHTARLSDFACRA